MKHNDIRNIFQLRFSENIDIFVTYLTGNDIPPSNMLRVVYIRSYHNDYNQLYYYFLLNSIYVWTFHSRLRPNHRRSTDSMNSRL